jgi:hypothetical protein
VAGAGKPGPFSISSGSAPAHHVRVGEIACDESGYEGEKLIGSTTRLFAHASVRIPDPAAVLTELRERIRSPATQYKANHLLREKHRPVLRWFLGPTGPVIGRGHVFLLDKAEFVRSALRSALGVTVPPDRLGAANDLLRGRDVELFSGAVRQRADAYREWLNADPIARSVLDPLLPAVVAAVEHWGSADRSVPVDVAHDRQTQLPPRRVEILRSRCALGEIRFLDAGSHPEIQIADMLAGTVRRITENGDMELSALLPPYLEP